MKILLLIFLIAVIAVYGSTTIQSWQDGQFLNKSLRTTGTVEQVSEVVVDQKNQRKALQVQYRFTDPNGVPRVSTETVEYPDIWEQFSPGQRVTVLFRKDHPEECHLEQVLIRRMQVQDAVLGK